MFEEINPEKENLLELIEKKEERRSLSDEDIVKIHQLLAVSSFEEFVQKFEPSVHMLLDTAACTVTFSREYLGKEEESIRLEEKGSLFEALLHMMEARQKKRYILTEFGNLTEHIIPKEETASFLSKRNTVIKRMQEESTNPMAECRADVIKLAEEYDDGILLLKAFLEDASNLVANTGNGRKADKAVLEEVEGGQLCVLNVAERYRTGVLQISRAEAAHYKELIQQCFKENTGTKLKNAGLLKDCFLLPAWVAEQDYEMLQARYKAYHSLYVSLLKKFWVAAKPLIETMLGVYQFFLQSQSVEDMKPVLVIGNFHTSEILNRNNMEKLELYLSSVNLKSFYENTIWYAIVPNMDGEDGNTGKEVRERFKSRGEQFSYQRKENEELFPLLETLSRYRIQSFLSMALTEENTFAAFARNGLDGINDRLSVFDRMQGKDYLIPCFPNFLVVPREDACLRLGRELEYDELTEQMEIREADGIWVDMIGVEAAFVAAGLVAACQSPQYLKSVFKKGVQEEIPGVAYRFSEENHNLVTVSAMLAETLPPSEHVLRTAEEKSRGFLFAQKEGKMIVLTDRAFSYSRGNPLLLSMVQTSSYIERVIQCRTQDWKKNLIVQFFQKKSGSDITKWHYSEKEAVNGILKEGEELDYQIQDAGSQCTFEIRFQNHDLIRKSTVSVFQE